MDYMQGFFLFIVLYFVECLEGRILQDLGVSLQIPKEVVLTDSIENNAPDIIYISFSSPISAQPDSHFIGDIFPLKTLLKADDSPYEPVDLPFQFNFFGQNLHRIYADPNGALHVNANQCSCDCFCGDFNSSYTGVIAGYLADLFPPKSKFANITYMAKSNKITFLYSHIPFFSSPLNSTFGITLYSDGRTQIQYFHVNSQISSDTSSNGGWISGLRPPSLTGMNTNFTASQLETGYSSWGTSYPGIYPLRSEVQSGLEFNACPVSTAWCAIPKIVDVSAPVAAVSLTPFSISCTSELEFVLYLSTPSLNVDLSASSTSVTSCTAYNLTSIYCDLKKLPPGQLTLGTVSANIAWRRAHSSTSYTALHIPSIPLTLATTHASSSTATQCSVNQYIPGCTTPTAVCELCALKFQCMGLSCGNSSTTLYSYPVCNNSCSQNYIHDSSNGQCCNFGEQDCNGHCFGTATIAYSLVGALVCCTSNVDCFGVCGGKDTIDCAGVCGGKFKLDACGNCLHPKYIVKDLECRPPTLLYLSYSAPIPKADATGVTHGPSTVLQLVEQADDSPFQEITLPFPFNFFGQNIYRMYVGPNGAVHQSATQQCGCDCFCGNFNSSYTGVIAGFLADMNPSISQSTNITYTYSATRATVTFSRLPFFFASQNNTFSISLYPDGRMQIEYHSVNPATASNMALNPARWLSGMRPPSQPWGRTNFSSAQMQTGLHSWATSYPGVYPTRTTMVQSGLQFNACPISTVWCARPYLIDVSASRQMSPVTLTPMSMSCRGSLEFALYLQPSANLSATSKQISRCSQSVNGLSMYCNIKALPASLLREGPVHAYMAWRHNGSTTSFSPLDINPIPLNFSTQAINSTIANSHCSANAKVGGCTTDTCSLCAHNFQCLNLTCYAKPVASLYSFPTCNNSCSENLVYDTTSEFCCENGQQDCNGNCFGTAKIIRNTQGALVCCTGPVDCAGVCRGPAKRDACGMCNGPHTKSTDCKTDVSIATGFPSLLSGGSVYVTVSATQALGYQALAAINITNGNSSMLSVSFVVMGRNPRYGPSVAVVGGLHALQIPPHTSHLAFVNVSLAALMSGRQSMWEVKQILVSYTRPTVWQYTITYPISVYPSTSDCASVAASSNCMRLPGCIFCLTYANIRLLSSTLATFNTSTVGEGDGAEINPHEVKASSEADIAQLRESHEAYLEAMGVASGGEDDKGISGGVQVIGESSEASQVAGSHPRALYASIVPQQVGVIVGNYKVGTCSNGWRTEDCSPKYASGGHRFFTHSSSTVAVAAVTITSMCLLLSYSLLGDGL